MKNTSLITEFNYLARFIRTLKLEGVVLALLMATLTYKAGTSLWFLAATFLLFDISAAGYSINNRVGAIGYNIGHSSIIPTLMIIYGLLTDTGALNMWGQAWLFHIGVDRALGYGLKHPTSFKHTHLGHIGKK